jgi:hypothetical protein
MFYLKINDKIQELISLLNIQIGCKYYCKYQLIALDELEFLRKELKSQNIITLTNQEYEEIKKSSEKVYYHSTHICIPQNPEDKKDVTDDEKEFEELLKDKQSKPKKETFEPNIDYEYRLKQQDEENKKVAVKKDDNSLSFAMNMIGSFFLVVLGSYYFGKYFLELEDAVTYKLVLVVTIVVFLAETVLLMIKLHRDSEKLGNYSKGKNNSFAYRFNRKYRIQNEIKKNNKEKKD